MKRDKTKSGIIFNIQRFSLHDGPGIRTTVFLKGCPLDCVWCHNPESKSIKPQIAFSENRCLGCGQCELVCKNGVHTHTIDFETGNNVKKVLFDKCLACGKCVEVCPAVALEIFGKERLAQEILEEVVRDKPFYKNSGGGVTLSGGEPAMQADFASAILEGAKKEEIHTAMETAGFVEWDNYERILPWLDMVLFDIKQMDSVKHQMYTGKSNDKIHKNLTRLCGKDKSVKVVVRTPVIPGYNDDIENFNSLGDFLNTMERIPEVELLPYNPLAGSKHPRLGIEYLPKIDVDSGNSPEKLCSILQNKGIRAKVLKA